MLTNLAALKTRYTLGDRRWLSLRYGKLVASSGEIPKRKRFVAEALYAILHLH
ncbi:hypothetical protein [Nostoc sp.]|uniref:hypothetical protein n=1 Tax=Nostoc sp. TaxID=1180 RepID=UPI002FF54771